MKLKSLWCCMINQNYLLWNLSRIIFKREKIKLCKFVSATATFLRYCLEPKLCLNQERVNSNWRARVGIMLVFLMKRPRTWPPWKNASHPRRICLSDLRQIRRWCQNYGKHAALEKEEKIACTLHRITSSCYVEVTRIRVFAFFVISRFLFMALKSVVIVLRSFFF